MSRKVVSRNSETVTFHSVSYPFHGKTDWERNLSDCRHSSLATGSSPEQCCYKKSIQCTFWSIYAGPKVKWDCQEPSKVWGRAGGPAGKNRWVDVNESCARVKSSPSIQKDIHGGGRSKPAPSANGAHANASQWAQQYQERAEKGVGRLEAPGLKADRRRKLKPTIHVEFRFWRTKWWSN